MGLNRDDVRAKIGACDSPLASPFPRFLKIMQRRIARAAETAYFALMKLLIPALLAALAFASCVPSTPQARIDRNPEKFSSLSRQQQDLVRQGQLAPGMPPDAVLLAWGSPEQTFDGSKNGKRTSRWDYASLQPVYTTGFYGGYGYGRYPYGRYYGGGFAVGPEIAYIPSRVASVWFVNERVDGWERLR
jgi:outer membrane protein assembly factor BamE (lipoprotein component of BamABCDE complex)